MYKKITLSLITTVLVASQSSALVYDAFNYTPGEIGTAAANGTGQTGNWGNYAAHWLGGAPAGTANTNVVSGSLSAPTGYSFAPTGNRISSADNTFGMFGLDSSNRIDLDSAGTHYVSFLFNVSNPADDSNDRGGIQFRGGPDGTDANNTLFSVGDPIGENQLGVSTAGSNAGTSLGSNWVAGDMLVLIKIETLATLDGNDTISASFFSSSGSVNEPVTWDVSHSSDMTGEIFGIGFNTFGTNSSTTYQFDEFRMGTSYTEVVPEPSTYALLSGALALCWVMFRRRN